MTALSARCFVRGFLAEQSSQRIAGYYTLASASISLADLPADVAKKLPRYPAVPAVRLGRLTVDQAFQGRGVGGVLLAEALARALRADIAAYAMVVKLLASLKEKGITQFDFGGIAPASLAASGVNHFKRGFGGELVEYLGEWEWVVSPSVRWGANYLIKRTKRM